MKRFTSMFLAVCMLALPVSGCSQSSGAEASTSAASTASGDAAEEMITLTYWDGWADAGTEPTAAAVTYSSFSRSIRQVEEASVYSVTKAPVSRKIM